MIIQEFIEKVRREGFIYKSVYHFTDSSNVPSIRKHGLLCKATLDDLGLTPEKTGGDENSLESDIKLGNNYFVSLCLAPKHDMAFRCRQDGRHPDQRFIAVDLEVLLKPNTLLCLGLANSSATPRFSLSEGLRFIDFDAFYKKNERPFSEIRDIVDQIRKFEILVPERIEPNYLRDDFKPRG